MVGMHMSLSYRSAIMIVIQQVVDFNRVKSLYNFEVQWLQLAVIDPAWQLRPELGSQFLVQIPSSENLVLLETSSLCSGNCRSASPRTTVVLPIILLP